MPSTYSVWWSNPTNVRLVNITRFISLEYTRGVNAVGALTMVIVSNEIDPALLVRDARLEVWRSIGESEYLDTGTQWFLRKVEYNQESGLYTLSAESAVSLLGRRIVAYDPGSSESVKSGAADTVITAFVDENLGSSATDSARDLSQYFTVLPATGNGPTVYKEASRGNLLSICQEVCNDAVEAGTPTFFDVNYNTGTKKLEFNTYTQQRGNDRTSGTGVLTLGADFGTLRDVIRTDNWEGEITYVYATGMGFASYQLVEEAGDDTRIGLSPFGRIEETRQAQNVTDLSTSNNNPLLAEAQAGVREGRPRRVVQAKINADAPGAQYGVNWSWGDKVKTDVDGEVQTARVDAVKISVTGKRETVEAVLRIED